MFVNNKSFFRACIGGMTVSNEQATATIYVSRDALRCACADIANWLALAARELTLSFVPPIDLVVQTYRDDLRSKFIKSTRKGVSLC